MAEVIRMPRLSDTMEEAVIIKWQKNVGDKIKPGDVLADVETDKATMEMESYNEGTLLHIAVGDGKKALVEEIIAVVGKEGEDYQSLLQDSGSKAKANKPEDKDEASKKEEPKEEAAKKDEPKEKTEGVKESSSEANSATANAALPAGAKDIRMPLLSDTMTEGKIISWNKAVGDKVKSDDVLAEVETDKATMEIVGYEEGTLLYIAIEAGQAAKINQLIAIVGKEGTDISAYVAADGKGAAAPAKEEKAAEPTAEKETENKMEEAASPEAEAETDGRIKASPLAKKIAEEKGYKLSSISGTGDGGRITKRDVDAYTPAAKESKEEKTEQKATAPAPAIAAFHPAGEEGHTDVQLTQMRKVIARRLGESKFTAPHFYLTMEMDMDTAMAARTAMNELSPVKISFNDMLIKACATALKIHPDVNSSFMGDFIRQNHHIHIGSALALPEGLIVPVIKFADEKSLSQIAAEAKSLYAKAKDKKLQPAEFSGNTFTISNLGMMDIDEFTAIINPPDSCILAVGKIKEVVVKTAEGFGVKNVMKVTLSCDHRSVDGAVGAAFLQTLKKYVENPVMMLV